MRRRIGRKGARTDPTKDAPVPDAPPAAVSESEPADETPLRPAESRPRVSPPVRPAPAPAGRRGVRPSAGMRPGTRPPLPPGAGPGPRARPASPPGAPRGVAKRRRPRPAYVLLGLVVVVLVAGLGGYAIVTAGFFRVDRVVVRGAALLDPDAVVRATNAVGRDLYRVDPAAARARVERLSGVRAAEVRRVWPRTLVVTVHERTPVAAWQVGAERYLVDAEGVVLDFAPDPALLTIHQVDAGTGLVPGDRVDGDAVLLAVRLREAAPAAVGQQIVRFEWTQRAGLEAITDRGVRVRLGDGGTLDYQLAVWRGILDQARRDRTVVTEIDLRFGDRAVYR
jgi:cell division septal protein FtsQ